MKRIFIIVFLHGTIAISFSASAQVKSYVALYGGISNPSGAYGSTDYNNNQSGFAKRGITFAVDGAVYLYKNLGIGYTLSFQDQGKLNYNDTYNLATGYTTSYNADQASIDAYDRFHSINLLIGPQYSFTYHSFILDLRAFGGVVDVSSTPETKITLSGIPEQVAPFYQRRSHGTSFGYGASGGLRYKLGDSWTIGIKGAYISSDGTSVTTEGRVFTEGRVVTKLPIREFQTTFGFSLSF